MMHDASSIMRLSVSPSLPSTALTLLIAPGPRMVEEHLDLVAPGTWQQPLPGTAGA